MQISKSTVIQQNKTYSSTECFKPSKLSIALKRIISGSEIKRYVALGAISGCLLASNELYSADDFTKLKTPGFDSASYLSLRNQVAAVAPDLDRFEYIGRVWPANIDNKTRALIVKQEGQEEVAENINELLTKRRVKFEAQRKNTARDLARKFSQPENDFLSSDAARGILVSADGRVFLERPNVLRTRLEKMPFAKTSGVSKTNKEFGTLQAASSRGVSHELAYNSNTVVENANFDLTNPVPVLFDNIEGNDGRQLVSDYSQSSYNSSHYPWRAVGVSLLKRNCNDDSCWWSRGAGSGAMIGPRAVLTVAHVITPNGSDFNVLRAAPGARGYSYSNDNDQKFPFGLRWVQWYYWPSQYDGNGIKFDYGVLILGDESVSPGWINFGYQTTTWLDWRNFNTAGYPSPSKACSDSPVNSGPDEGECNGYMYRQYEKVTSVFTNTAYHKFDVQEGQSGAPIYRSSNGNRTVYMLHKSSGGGYGRAKRLRSGSFNTICNWVENWPSSYFNNVNCN